MVLSRALTWLCEPPQNNVTLSGLLRRGWPGFANVHGPLGMSSWNPARLDGLSNVP